MKTEIKSGDKNRDKNKGKKPYNKIENTKCLKNMKTPYKYEYNENNIMKIK